MANLQHTSPSDMLSCPVVFSGFDQRRAAAGAGGQEQALGTDSPGPPLWAHCEMAVILLKITAPLRWLFPITVLFFLVTASVTISVQV